MSITLSGEATKKAFANEQDLDVVTRCRLRFDRFTIEENLLARTIGARWVDHGSPVLINVLYEGSFPERVDAFRRLAFYLRALANVGPHDASG